MFIFITKLKNFLKRRRLRTLADMDNLTMSEVDNLLKKVDNPPEKVDNVLPNIDAAINKKKDCPKCGGNMSNVIPEIKMESLMLKECETCHERCYLLV